MASLLFLELSSIEYLGNINTEGISRAETVTDKSYACSVITLIKDGWGRLSFTCSASLQSDVMIFKGQRADHQAERRDSGTEM